MPRMKHFEANGRNRTASSKLLLLRLLILLLQSVAACVTRSPGSFKPTHGLQHAARICSSRRPSNELTPYHATVTCNRQMSSCSHSTSSQMSVTWAGDSCLYSATGMCDSSHACQGSSMRSRSCAR